MAETVVVSSEIKAEAAAWLALLRADNRSAADERAFRAWLTADPAHTVAFETVTTVWDIAGGLRTSNIERVHHLPVCRRAVLAGLGSLAAAGLGLGIWQRAYAGVYQTEVGEQKHVALEDGTQAFLDTDTRICARYSGAVRAIQLDRGRCNFHVVPDANRPFVVDAAGAHIVVTQTDFDVRRDDDLVSVVLLQGRPAIISERAGQGREVVTAGERLVVTASALHVDKPNLTPLLAWQSGQAMFENETLAEAAAEMNRYSSVKLEIADAAVAKLRISGVYRVGDNTAFARSVATLLPVEAHFAADEVRLLPDASRMPRG